MAAIFAERRMFGWQRRLFWRHSLRSLSPLKLDQLVTVTVATDGGGVILKATLANGIFPEFGMLGVEVVSLSRGDVLASIIYLPSYIGGETYDHSSEYMKIVRPDSGALQFGLHVFAVADDGCRLDIRSGVLNVGRDDVWITEN